MDELLDLAEEYYERENFEQLSEVCHKILHASGSRLRYYSERMLVNNYLGKISQINRDFEKALAYYRKIPMLCLEKRPKAILQRELAVCYAELGDLNRAKTFYKRALRGYDGEDKDISMANLAGIYLQQHKPKQAIKLFEEILRLFPTSEIRDYVLFNLGESYYLTQKYTRSEKCFREYLDSFASSEEYVKRCHYYLGHIYQVNKNYQRSNDEYNAFADKSDLEAQGHISRNIAVNYYYLGKYAYSIQEAQKAIELGLQPDEHEYALFLTCLSAEKLGMTELYSSSKNKLLLLNKKSKYLRQLPS
jgi:tetratricopeptide (TPR) repeat protein